MTKNQQEFAKQQARINRLIKQAQKQGLKFEKLPVLETPKRVTQKQIEIARKITKKDIVKKAINFNPIQEEVEKISVEQEPPKKRIKRGDFEPKRLSIYDKSEEIKEPKQRNKKPKKLTRGDLRLNKPPKYTQEELHEIRSKAAKKAQETFKKKYTAEEIHKMRVEWARKAQETLRTKYTPQELHKIRSEAAKKAVKTLRQKYTPEQISEMRRKAYYKGRNKKKETGKAISYDEPTKLPAYDYEEDIISDENDGYDEEYLPSEAEAAYETINTVLSSATNNVNTSYLLLRYLETVYNEDRENLLRRIINNYAQAIEKAESVDYPSSIEDLRNASHVVAQLIFGVENPSFDVNAEIEEAMLLDLPWSTFGKGKIYDSSGRRKR